MFLPGKSDGKFGVLKPPVSREIYVGIPVNFLYIKKDFRGTDIHHFNIKNALVKI